MSGLLPMPPMSVPAAVLERAQQLLASALQSGQRKLLGIAAAPGAGKSTLASALQRALGPQALVVPMDGFHLANGQLQRLNRAARKGAADTFDVAGYANLLQRIRHQQRGLGDNGVDNTIFAPDFNRDLEEAIAGAIAIGSDNALVITEGNYLLRPEPAWQAARASLDAVWYLDVDDTLRQQRLLERHMRYGRTREQALAWMAQSDEPNAVQIRDTRALADWVMTEAG